jgi:hypothetical protein
MKITFESDGDMVIKKVDGETWMDALECFFYAMQGLGYTFSKTPEQMLSILDDGINK